MLGYDSNISAAHVETHKGALREMPVILSIVIYHGRRAWTASRSLLGPSCCRSGMVVTRDSVMS